MKNLLRFTFLPLRRSFLSVATYFSIAMIAVVLISGCQPSDQTSQNSAAKPLTGIVLSVNEAQGMVSVRHEKIEGEMEAMDMPFLAANPEDLEGLRKGDEIKADYFVSERGAMLENIKVVGHQSIDSTDDDAAEHSHEMHDAE